MIHIAFISGDQDGPRADSLSGTGGADTILGVNLDDTLLGLGGADQLSGGLGRDSLFGGTGNDALFGGSGNDVLHGYMGAFDLDFTGDDAIRGDTGNDRLRGDGGRDTLWGDAGADTCEFLDETDSPIGKPDLVHFRRDGDRISIQVDEVAPTGWVGTGAFAGGGRSSVQGAPAVVRVDVYGDRTADMLIEIAGGLTLVRGDFIL